jgi:hypothetical protein
LDKPHYPIKLADNFKAFCKYKIEEELVGGNKNLKVEKDHLNNNFGDSLSLVNKYLRNQLSI